jgi:hypothetical protein
MCVLCLQLIRDLVTPREALSNLGEMIDEVGDEHAKKVVQLISIKSQQLAREEEERKEEDDASEEVQD